MARVPITERDLPTLRNLHYIDPEETISIHTIFDMMTCLTYSQASYRADNDYHGSYEQQQWDAITHALLAMGVENHQQIQNAQQCTSTRLTFEVLWRVEDREANRLLKTLWKARCAYMSHQHSWKGRLEGHPIVAGISFRENWSELGNIADDIIRTAKNNALKAREIDLFILKLWGQTKPLKTITVNDLAKVTRSIIEMNALYDEEEFDLTE